MLEKMITDHWSVVLGVLAGAFGYGRLTNKAKNNCARITKLEGAFLDSDGNQRLLTVAGHKDFCWGQQEIINTKLDNLIKTSDQGEEDHKEFFERLTVIETTLKQNGG